MALSTPNFLRGNTPRPGQPITTKSFGDLSAASTAARQVPQPNVSSVFTAGGIVVFPPPNRAASTPAPIVYTPFQIFAVKHLVAGTWDGTYDVTLYPGTVNQLLPSNMFSTINATITSTQYVILTGASDGYVVTDAPWSIVGTQPTPTDAVADTPPSTFYAIIGVILYNSGPNTITIRQIIDADITAIPSVWTTIARSGAGPFELAYVNYYYWNIT